MAKRLRQRVEGGGMRRKEAMELDKRQETAVDGRLMKRLGEDEVC
jgi:hypothetical protein